MKILFNIEDADISSDEIKEHIGYVDADLNFKNLLPDIITASNELKKLLGKEVFDHLHKHYTDGLVAGVFQYDFTDYQDNILRAIRYPSLVKAYALYAPTNDLSHSNDGRTARSNENSKTPWQWQIDEDNKAQEKRYYRALDDLIELLDDSKQDNYNTLTDLAKADTIYHKWINSEAYKALKSLFVNSVDDFSKYFQIESRLLLQKIAPGMSECERKEILPRIGKEKFDLLKLGTISTENKELFDLIQAACTYYAMAWAIPRFSVTLFPEGVLQYQVSDRTTTNAKKPALLNEHELSRQTFAGTVKSLLIDIENLVKPVPDVLPSVPQEYKNESSANDNYFSAT